MAVVGSGDLDRAAIVESSGYGLSGIRIEQFAVSREDYLFPSEGMIVNRAGSAGDR